MINLAIPRLSWELTEGWKFKNAEPSNEALGFIRLGGGIAVFTGIMMLF
ncbi:DUF6199 family natural product biosynthesis protein [Wukongibacter sp. M2B1]